MFSETRLNVHCVELRVTRKTLLYLQHVEPQHSGDEVGNVLADLHDDMERELDRTHAQADKALRDKQKVCSYVYIITQVTQHCDLIMACIHPRLIWQAFFKCLLNMRFIGISAKLSKKLTET